MSVVVLTFLILSLTCTPLLAQTPFTSSDYDFNMTTEQPEDPDVTLDMKAMPSPSSTSSRLKNISTFDSQPSNVPVRETTAVLTAKNTAVTVAETTAESILETTIGAILKTTAVPSTETNSGHTFERTPLPSLETVASSIHKSTGGTWPHALIQTIHHVSRLIPTQGTTPEAFTSTPSSSTSQTGQGTKKGTAEDSTSLASKSYPTKILTVPTPSIIPESAQNTLSKPSSDPTSTPAVGSATTGDVAITRSMTQWSRTVIIIIIAVLVCMSGIIFMSMFFKKRKKRRSEDFSSSFMNEGSSKSKRKKGTEDDAWFGPVALKGEEEVDTGEEGKEVDGKREGEGVQVVLSTFMAKEEKDEVNGGCVGVKTDEEVPLLVTDEDAGKAVTSAPPLSSSLPPALFETGAGEQNGTPAFCLTSAV